MLGNIFFVIKCFIKNKNREGCCRCSLPCPGQGFEDNGSVCIKAKPYETNVFTNLKQCKEKNKLNKDVCIEIAGQFTEECDSGYIRTGRFRCRKTCPIGWPDEGEYCSKIGITEDSLPFPWMPGDPKA